MVLPLGFGEFGPVTLRNTEYSNNQSINQPTTPVAILSMRLNQGTFIRTHDFLEHQSIRYRLQGVQVVIIC